MNRLATGLAIATIATVFGAADFAQAEGSGATAWYGEVRSASIFAQDSDQEILGLDSEVSLDMGWMAEIATGYAHASGFRGELAFGYRRSEFDEIELEGFGSADLDGRIWGATALANGYFDIYLDRLGVDGMFWSRFRPFVGGGIGAAYLEVDGDLDADGDFALAYQGIAGMSYAFSPQWDLTLNYTYLSALDPKFDGVKIDYDTHNIGAGLRFRFY